MLEYLEHLETYKPSAPDPESQPINKGNSSLHNSFDYSATAHVRFRSCAELSEVAASRDRYDGLDRILTAESFAISSLRFSVHTFCTS